MQERMNGGMTQAYELLARAAERRSAGWRTLALATFEPTQEWVQALLSGGVTRDLLEATSWLDDDGQRFSEALSHLQDFLAANHDRDAQEVLRDLKVEYTRLFLGPGEAPVYPYESIYRDKDPMSGRTIIKGPSTRAVEALYRQHGLRLSADIHDLPDHIAIEMEFMYFLTDKESAAWRAGDVETAKELRRAEQEFMVEHLCHWAPEFSRKLHNTARSKLYLAVAVFMREYLAIESGSDYARAVLPAVFKDGRE